MLAGALLVLCYPNLVTASMSGMELPAAALVMTLLLLACRLGRAGSFAALSFAAPLVRPELTLVPFALAVLTFDRANARRHARLLGAAAAGTALAWAAMIARNYAVSGRPLPSTIYAKATPRLAPGQIVDMLQAFPLLGTTAFLALLGAALLYVIVRRVRARRPLPLAAAAVLTGAAYFVAASSSTVMKTSTLFYFWRYPLPGVVLIAAGLIPLLDEVVLDLLNDRHRQIARVVVPAASLLAVAIFTPSGHAWLLTDTVNIDSIQVEIGRFLAQADSSQTAWVYDAGATRYFGRAFVVDLAGLNTPQMLDARFADYLAAHPPNYLVQLRSAFEVDDGFMDRAQVKEFQVDLAKYPTVEPWVQERVIICPPGVRGTMRLFTLRGERMFDFTGAGQAPQQ
jgi:hypothetical protein